MARTSAISWLLFLLVLLPTGVLAALGFRAADAFDAADATRLRTDLEVAGRELERGVRAASAAVAVEVHAAVQAAAASVARRATHDAALGVPAELQAAGIQVRSATLYDTHGRSLWPVEYVGPGEKVGRATRQLTTNSLLTYLRRRADRAYFGEGQLEAAAMVWRDARARLRSPGLQQLADVEVARIVLRASHNRQAAVQVLEALRERWGVDALKAGESARPWLLLRMAAAAMHAAERDALAEQVAAGRTALTPLTVEERRRLRALAGASPGAPAREQVPEPGVFQAPVSHGARLEVEIEAGELLRLLRARLAGSSFGPILYQLSPATVAAAPRNADGHGSSFVFELPGAATALAAYEHKDLDKVRVGSRQRRLALSMGVTALFLLTLLGLGLTRRALARERAAQRLRDEFIANVTHEVRTPLTSVLLHSELLADEAENTSRRREHADVVRAQGKRLAQLVDDMLDFSALERGTRSLESVPLDLGAACREVVAPYAVLAEREGVQLSCAVTGEEVAGMGDPAALARILANLLGNAWKHGRPARDGGSGQIAVCAFDTGGVPTVEVRDDGPGIPPAERAQIFVRFGRGRGASQKEGAGIGLSLSHDLAQAMGGSLEVREEAGETVFRLCLPEVPAINVDPDGIDPDGIHSGSVDPQGAA